MFAALPLMFEPNQGQANLDTSDPRAKFLARGAGYGLFLGNQGAILTLTSRHRDAAKRSTVVPLEMKLAGASSAALVAGDNQLPGTSNYYIGNDPSKWRQKIPHFARVRYESIYPGINLVFYGNQGSLEYDFQVAPGSDPSQAELEFNGARELALKDGALEIETETATVRLEAPRVYQQIAGRQQPVEGRFELRGPNRAGFSIGAYDHSRELIIDPVLSFGTYYGGTGNELNSSVAVDGSFNLYLAGSTTSPTLPGITTTDFQQAPNGAQNVYIAKITPSNAAGSQIVDVTYLGGSGPDYPVGIAVDGAQNVFVAGTTQSGTPGSPTAFPTTQNGYQSTPLPGSTGTQHAFVTELRNDFAILLYSSYLSGNGSDTASGMAIDPAGNIYVTGTTTSNNAADAPTGIEFPASTIPQGLPFQPLPASGGSTQFFVTKVTTQAPKAASIAYSTYFGGGNFIAPLVATGGGITVDSNGNIYFGGTTNMLYFGCAGCGSTDFPIKNPYQPCLNQVPPTTIVNPPQCPTTGNTTNTDAFVAKLNPNASQGSAQLQWSTYLGGAGNDLGTGVAIDSGAANIYVTGSTNSSPFASSATNYGSYQPCLDGGYALAGTCPTGVTANDAFVARVSNPATSGTTTSNVSLTYFTYLGGSDNEAGLAVTVDAASGAIVTGWTESPDFPVYPMTNNDIQGIYGGNRDAFIARINTAAVSGSGVIGSWATYYGGSGVDEGTGIALDTNQNTYVAGDTTSTNLQVSNNSTLAGGSDAFIGQVSSVSTLSITGTLSLGTNQTYIAAGSQAIFTYILTNNGPDLATNITFIDDIRQGTTGVPVTFVSGNIQGGPSCSGGSTSTTVSCTLATLQSGSTATITITLTPTPSQQGGAAPFNGGSVTATASNSISSPPIQVPAEMSDFSMTVSPNNVSLQAAGDAAKFQIQLTPNPVYGTGISLGVSNLPLASTSTFSTSPVTLGNTPAAITLTISTTARPIVTPAAIFSGRQFYALWLSMPALAVLGFGMGGTRRRRRIAGLILLSLISLMLVLLPACSHTTTQIPPSGTPAGTYNLQVNATAGGDTKSYPIQLTVP